MIAKSEKMDALAENIVEQQAVKGRSLWQDAMGRFARNKAAVASVFVLIIITVLSFVGPMFSPWDYETIDWAVMGNAATLGYPSIETGHYFGTDDLGRDIFARTMQGTQISLTVGFLGAAVAVIVGTLYGAISGYVGGTADNVMMRIVDLLLSVPYMFVLILLLVVFGRSLQMLFVGIGLFAWMDMARIVRGQTLSIKNKEFIEAAVASGVGTFTIIMRHVVPNLLGVVIVYASLLVPQLILTESFISFLGLGVQEPMTSWGALINEGAKTMQYGVIWQLAFPLSFFIVGLFCFFFIGDGLRDAFDPKDR